VTGPLPTFMRVILVVWNVSMSVVCFTMFTWIVHDRRMPGWPDVLDRVKHGPLMDVAGHNVPLAVVVDVLIVAAFGLIHAGSARRSFYQGLTRTIGVPPPALRTVFMTLTAAAWLAVMLLWQSTGVIVFDSRPMLAALGIAPVLVDEYGPLIPFAFVLLCLWTVVRHDPFRFVGIRQLLADPECTDDMGRLRRGATPRLLTTGMYGVVRHPIYLYLLASVVVRPVLSLDLLVWFASLVGLLIVALPHEERKLIAVFGDAYRTYQRRTPAFIPLWPTRRLNR
jgi:protein-S-isoprenylcysteine O-methyltransferase Ste14